MRSGRDFFLIRARFGTPWRPNRALMGSLGRLLGSLRRLLGATWAPLGRHFGATWAPLGRSWGALGVSKRPQEAPKRLPRGSKKLLGLPGEHFGGPRSFQERPKSVQERPKNAQDRPMSSQDPPENTQTLKSHENTQNHAKTHKNVSHERPRSPREHQSIKII